MLQVNLKSQISNRRTLQNLIPLDLNLEKIVHHIASQGFGHSTISKTVRSIVNNWYKLNMEKLRHRGVLKFLNCNREK